MPDVITAAERAAIDSFPSDRIRRIPLGHMATATEYRWTGNSTGKDKNGRNIGDHAGFGRLVATNGQSLNWRNISAAAKRRDGIR